jgi:hypothetical protein
MGSREVYDIRQHRGGKVSALDTEVVEYMDQTVGCRKICFCHECTSLYD